MPSRKDLLPSYVSQQAWLDLCDAIDYVFADTVDEPTNTLGKLREMFLLNAATAEKEQNHELISSADLDSFDKDILIKQLGMLGLSLRNRDAFTVVELQRMVRYLPEYWYSKGKGQLADFVSLVLGTRVTMTRLWTEDYVDFYDEGDPAIGTPIYEGGTWYPTTHTRVEYNLEAMNPNIDVLVFASFFEAIANYVLVFYYIVQAVDLDSQLDIGIAPIFFDCDTVANFSLGAEDLTPARGQGGGFTTIVRIPTDHNT
jgi:hypothetical protein